MISVTFLRKLEKVPPDLRDVLITLVEEIERQREESVTKREFNELKEIVKKLAEAQKKTEHRLNELAEAQKKTEHRLNELAEAQKKTEQRLNELAEAQKKTEEELKKLVGEHRKTREELGKLSHSVGYVLEDRAFVYLPRLLKKDEGIDVEDLKRDFVELGPGRYEEVNILGKGYKDGKTVWIIGECKSQFKKKDVEDFLKKLAKIEHLFPGDRILIAVTYQTPPQIRELLREKGIRLYFSYQFGF
ncbi:MAG: hypothetical protein WHS38_02855 [Thermodesulforhabdaceae bacterium]